MCKKCGCYDIEVRYRKGKDMLEKTCLKCGYWWMDDPADKRRQKQEA